MTTTDHTQGLTSEEKGSLTWPMSEELKLEAAMVLWEEIDACCQSYQQAQTTGNQLSEHRKALGQYRDGVGTAQLRHDIMPLIEPLHIAWHLAYHQGHLAEGFDWEFTPWFVAECVSCDKFGPSLNPDWQSRARDHGSPQMAEA